ncbi:hypothetical protein M514_24910 [Trichuris suis]|uniref:RNA-directed DNA polymerase n=1 Tax=Trichuris suis TaxID=68888 RepID=A0A085N074_9BILA|nr:hypothetical protein M514_24910 [Trichuris suis]
MGNAKPCKQPPRRIPFHQWHVVEEETRRMLRQGIIEPAHGPWACPVVLVRKKDGSFRFCVDYRKLNDVTRKNAHPLPRIDDTLLSLGGAQWFPTLDLASGFWQVAVRPEDREKTAFCTPTGLYQFNVMPFGLCNAPSTFQRLMEVVLGGLHWVTCLDYLEDIIVYSRTEEEHVQRLREVFKRLRKAGLKLKMEKCHFFKQEVKCLGHIVSADGVRTDPVKTEVVDNWPCPTSTKELRQFLGLASCYRRFVPSFASIAALLHKLMRKWSRWNWTTECEASFWALKAHLTSAPTLSFPDFSRPFILDTDASSTGLGAVLAQEVVGKEREPEGQVARWLELLSNYDFEVEHRPGSKRGNADALSQKPDAQYTSRQTDIMVVNHLVKLRSWLPNVHSQEMLQAQRRYPDIGPVLEWIQNGSWPEQSPPGASRALRALVPRLLEAAHDGPAGGHLRRQKTFEKLHRSFYWPNQREDVANWCAKVAKPAHGGSQGKRICLDFLGPFTETTGGNRYLLVVSDSFTKWTEAFPVKDMEGATTASVLVREWFCRYGLPEEILTDQGRTFVSDLMKSVCTLLDIRRLRTSAYHAQSNGQVERFNRTLLTMLSVTAEERPFDWDEQVPLHLFAYRTSVHSSTGITPFHAVFGHEAKLPADVMYGPPPERMEIHAYASELRRNLEEAYTRARQYIGQAQKRQKELFDRKANFKPLHVRDLVWLLDPSRASGKLYQPWTGPFKALEAVGMVNYKVQHVDRPSAVMVVHYDRLKKCRQRQAHLRLQATPIESGGSAPNRPQRHRRPPVALRGFVEIF